MDFCFYLITDRKATSGGRALESVLESAFLAGVKGVLLREKDLPDRELIALAQRLRDLTLRNRVRLLVSARVDVAMAVGADGVHLPAGTPAISDARQMVGDERYIAVSTHSIEEARRAEESGADFITFGPVFYTPSKANFGPPLGLRELERVCREVRIPVFALGGINQDNVLEVMNAGAFGVAAVSAVISADDPGQAALGLMERIRSYKMRRCI